MSNNNLICHICLYKEYEANINENWYYANYTVQNGNNRNKNDFLLN